MAGSLVNTRLGVTAATGPGGATTFYIRTPNGDLLAEYDTGATNVHYYLTNAQKSVTGLLNSGGDLATYYRYSPYGNPTIVTDDTTTTGANNPWRYIGGYYDIEGDGYTQLGARYTDNHSHFNQPDPKPGTLGDPLTTLTYAYAGGDPINHTDANGQGIGDIVGGIALGVTSVLGGGTGYVLAAEGAAEYSTAIAADEGLLAIGLGAFGVATGAAFIALTAVAVIYGAEKLYG